MNKSKIYLFLIWILTSCGSNSSSMFDFPVKDALQAESKYSSAVINPVFFAIQAGYLCTYSLQKDTMIDMFSLPNLAHKKSFGVRGQAPDEFQSFPWPCKSTNEQFYVRGYTPLTIKQFTVEHSLNFRQNDEFTLKEFESFGPMHIVQDSLLIYTSMGNQNERGEQISIKKYCLRQKRETGKVLIPTSSAENASIDPNRAGGFDVSNSFIVYAYLFQKQIDIYDVRSLKLVHRLKNSKNKKVHVMSDFAQNTPHYQGVIAGEKYFYALYNKKGCTMNKPEPASQVIEVFDYDGNAIAEYAIDKYINLFALDEKNHTFYAYDASSADYILKYNLPKTQSSSNFK